MTQQEFEILIGVCQPHLIKNKDWRTYYAILFADVFLPKAHLIRGKALHIYDGAELFMGVQPAAADFFQLADTNKLVTMIIYTYPKGVEAEVKKDRVQPAEHEVLLFMELDVEENIEMHFRFGRDFKQFLSDQRKSTYGMENTSYKTTIDELNQYFANGTTA